MDTILNHPYKEPTQIAEFNAVAELIGCKPLHYEKPETQENSEPIEGVVMDESEPPPKTQPSFDIKDILNNVFTSVFSLMPQWGVTVREVDMLSEAWGGAVDYWFPSLNENLTPASNAYLTTAIVIMPRLLGKQEQQSQSKPKPTEQTQTFGDLKNE